MCSREREPKEETKLQKLTEAESLLLKARDFSPVDSKANCYLGLCHSEQTRVANKFLLESGDPSQQQSGQGIQQKSQQFLPRYNAVGLLDFYSS